jgi:hypothetical protein
VNSLGHGSHYPQFFNAHLMFIADAWMIYFRINELSREISRND